MTPKTYRERLLSASKRIWHRARSEYGATAASPLFLAPLALKLLAATFAASTFGTKLFIPFLKYHAAIGGMDPYLHSISAGVANAFPYPNVMLWAMTPLYGLMGLFSDAAMFAVSHLDLLALRLPLLAADIGILAILLSWFGARRREVLWLYWCSPVLFYISYVHGQLDAVPIFLLFGFLYLLFKERDLAAMAFLGLAISAKTGMVIVLPFVFLYLLKERRSLADAALKTLMPLALFLVLNASRVFDAAFIEMVFKAKEQFKVLSLSVAYGDSVALYVLPLAYALLLARFCLFKRYSRDLFMVFFGFAFSLLTLFIAPMPGWYFWVVPFAAYFYAGAPGRYRVLYHGLAAAYFAYFLLIPASDLPAAFAPFATAPVGNLYGLLAGLGLPAELISNLAFTALQAALLVNVVWMYRRGIEEYVRYKIHYQPFLVGIAGDSGSGKTTVTELLMGVFGGRNVSVLAGDDMHKWERGNEMWSRYTHLDPRANELHSDIESVYSMKRGSHVDRRAYDHALGTFTLPRRLDSKRLVVLEGLHSLFLEKVRKALDLKIFVSPEEQLRRHWKIVRDTEKRGHGKEAVLRQIESRMEDARRYIDVQEKHSDISITIKNASELGDAVGDPSAKLSLALEVACGNGVALQPLLDRLSASMRVDYRIDDDRQRLKFEGSIASAEVEAIAKAVIPELFELSTEERQWASDYSGVIQLLVTFYAFESMRIERYA